MECELEIGIRRIVQHARNLKDRIEFPGRQGSKFITPKIFAASCSLPAAIPCGLRTNFLQAHSIGQDESRELLAKTLVLRRARIGAAVACDMLEQDRVL